MDEIDIKVERLIEDAKKKAERVSKEGERSAVEFINSLADKAMRFTSDKLDKLEERLN